MQGQAQDFLYMCSRECRNLERNRERPVHPREPLGRSRGRPGSREHPGRSRQCHEHSRGYLRYILKSIADALDSVLGALESVQALMRPSRALDDATEGPWKVPDVLGNFTDALESV